MRSATETLQEMREKYFPEPVKPSSTTKKKETLLTEYTEYRDRLLDLLTTAGVPYSREEDDDTYEDYLLSDTEEAPKKKSKKQKENGDADLDLEERLASMKNKLRQKKGPTTERQQKRREAKKMKRSKGVQKLMLSSAKNLKNENVKQKKLTNGVVKHEEEDGDSKDSKALIKAVKQLPVYNQEGKIVYSKVDFAATPGGKQKKSHQNPREILKKLKDTKKQINELKEQGETEKAAEMQTDIAWKKAFDKVAGKKVKDDPKLLLKSIKKRKVEKKKAKTKWSERKQKVDYDKDKRQKKRQDNLEKRSTDKKKTKLKKASKRGRIIPGY
ncbi:surfeit locus protein 6 homolog [Drosophila obscura]|uniref:surfeit locus protein 6 homolog n=1 Tax=Drosophila obscura TaxID=7282 RepID=UPI000BA18EEC|nr:surfeit locus protein 6 homolog [Drosophila obscura]